MYRRKLLSIAAVASGGIITGCSSSLDEGGGDVEIKEHEMYRENEGTMSETVGVVGTAENVSDDELSYAAVEAKFYDSDDTVLDSFLDNVNDLGAGEQWKFDIQYPAMGDEASQVADYEISAGTNL